MRSKVLIGVCGGIVLVFVGFVGGYFIQQYSYYSTPRVVSADTDVRLINPSVTSNLGKHYIINFAPLKKDLVQIQAKYPQKTFIYFNYLNNSSWVGLNEKDMFTAASTIKVPLAMSIYKMIEEGKLKLADTYTLDQLDLDSNFGDLYQVGADRSFSVQELLTIMLERSDETAMNALYEVLTKIGIQDPFDGVYTFMGWDLPAVGQVRDYFQINLKTLSNMFLALYNATYLDVEHSEKVLELLSNTPFNDKIAAGVPTGVPVSHKIGISDHDTTYSDCGIVYAPNRNYLLCVGTVGIQHTVAAKFMADVSKAAYTYVMNN